MTWSNLARIVYRRTYARRKQDGSLENWEDTIRRAVAGNVKGRNVPEQEIKDLIRLGVERKAIPAGRGLWFSGTEAHERLGGVANCNCWYLNSSDWMNYVIAQDLLMLGGGVGLSVEHRFTSKLPQVKKDVEIVHKNTKDADFIIPDSREGWCELTRRILESYFKTGRSFSYSTICLRGYGELIKGFGGLASGPIPVINFATTLCELLNSREGRHIRPIDAADILTSIAQMVVSGNVRRSAIIIMGDPWDKEYLQAKRWDLATLPGHRACANYSVCADSTDDLHPLFWKTFDAGEAFGIINRKNIRKYGRMGELKKDTAEGVNPCQPAWARVFTRDGIRTLSDVNVGDKIWSGKNWTEIINKWSTGVKPVYAYHTTAGIFYGTEDHRVVSKSGKVPVKEATSITLAPGYVDEIAVDPQDIMDGLVIGDGSVHAASNNLVLLIIGDKDQDYFSSQIAHLISSERTKAVGKAWRINTTISPAELPKTYDRKIPDRFFYGDKNKVAGFLRGLYSANGSIAGERITLKAVSFTLISQVQEMLSFLGIRSYYTTNNPKNVKFSNGTYTCKKSYDLNITSDRGIFLTNIGFIQQYKKDVLEKICNKKKSIYANSVTKNIYEIKRTEPMGSHEVFDLAVDAEEHTYSTGGLLVSNCGEACLEPFEPCNLLESALPNMRDEDEFVFAAKLMYRYGKRVTTQKYHHPEIQSVVDQNRRIGIGITGCLSSDLFNSKSLDRAYQEVIKEDRRYSKELGVPESIRYTVVKPAGTSSKVLDMNGYEGVHAAYSRYIIQRVRFSANDSLIPLLKEAGHKIEPVINLDGTRDQGTLVADFYVKAPDGAPVADEDYDTWKQLDTLMLAQRYWSDQAVSASIYYKRQDIPKIKKWLDENIDNIKTISFLCHDEHGFKQAPKEAITQEQFEKLSSCIKPIDIDKVQEGDLDNLECEGGVCPVK